MYSNLGRKITNEEFDKRLVNFRRLEDYINTNTSIKFQCKRCNKIFKKKPKELSRLYCNCRERESEYLSKLNKNIQLIDNYINSRTELIHRCILCNLTFKSTPKSFLNSKNGCPNCSKKKFSTDNYKSKLPNNIILLEEYKGSQHKHKHKCLECENIFITKPNYILHMGTNCPYCNKSKGERYIHNYLKENNIEFQTEFIININNINLRFDFYLPVQNLFIEYDGIQHFKPIDFFGGKEYFNKLKQYDKLKNEYCNDNNINLIRISYKDNIINILRANFS